MNLPTVSEPLIIQSLVAPQPGNASVEAIRLENVGVRYRVPTERIRTFKEYMIRRIQRRVQNREFWACMNSPSALRAKLLPDRYNGPAKAHC